VDVPVVESVPPRAAAHVDQVPSGKTVIVTILWERPRDAVCTQIARLYRGDVPLEGTCPAGTGGVRDNALRKAFTTD
jgi:hypothetical protein